MIRCPILRNNVDAGHSTCQVSSGIGVGECMWSHESGIWGGREEKGRGRKCSMFPMVRVCSTYMPPVPKEGVI